MGDKRQDKSGRERESGKTEKYILVGCGNQILSWTSISSVSVCLSLFSGDCHCGVWRCQLRFRWLPTLTCRQWRQLQRSVSICKLYVLSPPENQMPFKVNLKHIFYFTYFFEYFSLLFSIASCDRQGQRITEGNRVWERERELGLEIGDYVYHLCGQTKRKRF